MIHQKRMNWFKQILNENIYPDIKYISEKNGDFGDLEGAQFNSNEKGGYIYFWSSGYVSFQIVDYLIGEEIIKDTLIEVKEDIQLNDILKDFLEKLNNSKPSP